MSATEAEILRLRAALERAVKDFEELRDTRLNYRTKDWLEECAARAREALVG